MTVTPDVAAASAVPSTSETPELTDIVQQIGNEAEHWAQELLVTIGRAGAISGLKESQIRYYEELGALQPATTTGRAGSSRLYGLSDLRRLRALALLAAHYKPSEAAEIVRRNAQRIEHGDPITIDATLAQEQHAVADGFVLTRVLSQVVAAIEAEVQLAGDAAESDGEASTEPVRVLGVLYPGRNCLPTLQPSPDIIAQQAAALCRNPAGVLVALCSAGSTLKDGEWAPELQSTTGSDAQTLMFFSREARPLANLVHQPFLAYFPADAPEQIVFVALSRAVSRHTTGLLAPSNLSRGRAGVLDRLLHFTHKMFERFQRVTRHHSVRYRSDGFPLDATRRNYTDLLKAIAEISFPGDPTAMAVLLVPDGLDDPQTLAILAEYGYIDKLVANAKIALSGDGLGLSGRAFISREPFVAEDAAESNRVQYGHEEGSRVALAVPLAATWGLVPFGVLYLASRRPEQLLTSETMFGALTMGSILSELLGRWWLTRLRKEQDVRLHQNMPQLLAWLDTLDAHGPDFRRGLAALVRLSEQLGAEPAAHKRAAVSIVVLDINHYRETIQTRSNDPFPVYAQLHVRAAIQRVLGEQSADCYWFGNDHALLLLKDHDREQAQPVVERIVDQVSASPVELPTRSPTADSISVSAAVKVLPYRSLIDLGREGPEPLRRHLIALIEQLRDRAGQAERLPRGEVRDSGATAGRGVFVVT
jgi:DNA-binding transcriptional MerR regulator/GGDEF domain-containing protein